METDRMISAEWVLKQLSALESVAADEAYSALPLEQASGGGKCAVLAEVRAAIEAHLASQPPEPPRSEGFWECAFSAVVAMLEVAEGTDWQSIHERVAEQLGIDLGLLSVPATTGPQWSEEWPTEPGRYWVASEGDGIPVRPVRVYPAGMFSEVDGPFIVASDGAIVTPNPMVRFWWMPLTAPAPPPDAAKTDPERSDQS